MLDDRSTRGVSANRPAITAHAQVRFVERYVDELAVQRARKISESDHAVLDALMPDYESYLARYRSGIEAALSRLEERHGPLPFNRFNIRAGSTRVAVVGRTCVTTLPPHEAGRPISSRRRPKRPRSMRTEF